MPFAKFDVRPKPCSIVVTYAGDDDQVRMVYDAEADATRLEPGGNQRPGYMDRNGYVGFDEETGRWVRATTGMIMQAGMTPPILFPWMTAAPRTATDHHRSPLAFVEMMKHTRRDVKQVKGMAREAPGPCPRIVAATNCIVLTFTGEGGGTRLYYGKNGEPLATENEDGIMTIEYTDDVVRVPI